MLRLFPRRWRDLIAIAAGLALATLPMLVVDFGLRHYIQREGQAEVQVTAKKAIARAEWRIDQALTGISALASTAVQACSDVDLGELRRAVMAITPVKELLIVGPDGAGRCAHLGLAGQSWILSREIPTTNDPNVLLGVVRLQDKDHRGLRIRWQRQSEPLSLAAVIPADMFLPDVDMRSGPDDPGIRIILNEGTLVVGGGPASNESGAGSSRLFGRAESDRYPLVVISSIVPSRLLEQHNELRTWGSIGSLAFSVLIILFMAFAPWRNRANPVNAIVRGIEANEFVPFFQPVIDLHTGRFVGAEILIRWRKPDGTLVPPASFIPLAESSGLIIDLTRSLMESVRDQAGHAIGSRPKFKVGFNMAAVHFTDERIVRDVKEVFGNSPIRFSQIVIEVTERQPIESLTSARRVIAALQALGCKVAIDDVGSGHAGLSYILKLGVNTIKIDKMFIDAIGNERYSTAIIDTLVELGRSMRLDIVAEGVESFEQVQFLREHGIRLAQGFVFAPPLPAKSFLDLLEAVDPRAQSRRGADLEPAATLPAPKPKATAA